MREPSGVGLRLCSVHTAQRQLALLALTCGLAFGAVPAAAQSTIEIDVATGIDGWIQPREPYDLLITVTSDVLFDGTIQATMGSIVVATAAQIPAGTTKRFVLTMPPPNSSGAIRVDVLDAEGDRLETARVTPRYPVDEVLVGVTSGGPRNELDQLRTPIVDRDIVALEVTDDQPIGVLDYFVSRAFGERELSFVEAGGVLVTEQAAPLDAIGVSSGDVDRFRLDDGEILVVDSIADVATYGELLIARARGSAPLEFWQSPDQGLSDAATNAGSGGVPELPWLFGALVGYTVLIGPVNFLVLRRLRRRDWAWLTIPAISLASLGVFWVVGGQRLEDAGITHATVMIGGEEPVERTAVVLAVGKEGSYSLGFADAEIVYPATLGNRFDEVGRPIATASGQVVGKDVRFDLQQLGFAGANAIGPPSTTLLTADDSGDTAVDVTNNGELSYWAWGVYDHGTITTADVTLMPGSTVRLDLKRAGQGQGLDTEFGFFLGDAVINQLGLFDDRAWRIISPLGNAAQFAFEGSLDRFVFGFSEDFQPSVTLDGQPVSSEGNALVIVPMAGRAGSGGSQGGSLLGIGSGFVEPSGGPGFEFVSTDEMWLGYRLPVEVTSARLDWIDRFGAGQLGQQAWDWVSGALVDVQIGEDLDGRFIDPAGNVILRVGANKPEFEGGFVELPMSPTAFTLSWGDR